MNISLVVIVQYNIKKGPWLSNLWIRAIFWYCLRSYILILQSRMNWNKVSLITLCNIFQVSDYQSSENYCPIQFASSFPLSRHILVLRSFMDCTVFILLSMFEPNTGQNKWLNNWTRLNWTLFAPHIFK